MAKLGKRLKEKDYHKLSSFIQQAEEYLENIDREENKAYHYLELAQEEIQKAFYQKT